VGVSDAVGKGEDEKLTAQLLVLDERADQSDVVLQNNRLGNPHTWRQRHDRWTNTLTDRDPYPRVRVGGVSRIGVGVSGRGLDCLQRRDLTAGAADIIGIVRDAQPKGANRGRGAAWSVAAPREPRALRQCHHETMPGNGSDDRRGVYRADRRLGPVQPPRTSREPS